MPFLMPLIMRFWPYISAVVVCIGIYSLGHMKGTSACEISNAKLETAAAQKGIKEHGKIEKNVMALSDADLDTALMRWLR